MKLEIGDYKIETDERSYIVQRKRVIQASHMTKAENVGKTTYGNEKYFSKLDHVLEYISNDVILQYDDLVEIKQKLDELQDKIKEFTDLLKLKV